MTDSLRAWALFVLVAIAACQSGIPPTLAPTTSPGASSGLPTPSPSPTPAPTNTSEPTPTLVPTPTPLVTVSSDTKLAKVTLDVPAPLIPAGTTITIEEHPPEDAPRDLTNAGVRQSFHLLEPQSLTFTEPVRVSVAMDRERFTRADGSVAIVYLAIRDTAGAWHWLADASETVTATTVELAGTTTTLGMLFAWSDLTNLVAPVADQGNRLVGQSFTANFLLVSSPRAHPVQFSAGPEFSVDAPAVLGLTHPSFICLAPGWWNVNVSWDVADFAADNPFLINNLRLPPLTGALRYVMSGSCSTGVNVTPPPPNSIPTSSP